MFSGLIGYRGTVVLAERAGDGRTLCVACEGVAAEKPVEKDSIAIDGVCLTAAHIESDTLTFDVVPETLARSTLGDRRQNDLVNVEYAMRAGERIGGHFVYGHVDAAARVLTVAREGQGKRVRVERPTSLAPTIVEKGFIAIDGVSLTIASTGDDWFEVALIPETLNRTTLGLRKEGDRVNIEVDPLARYVFAAVEAMKE